MFPSKYRNCRIGLLQLDNCVSFNFRNVFFGVHEDILKICFRATWIALHEDAEVKNSPPGMIANALPEKD